VLWAMTGADLYNKLVFERGWTADRYEEWLADAMMRAVLETQRRKQPDRLRPDA
jgi:hypothetical protein